jgi:hypothetical protein
VKAGVRAGSSDLRPNHNLRGLKIKTAIKAGGLFCNHNRSGLSVKAGVRAGSSDLRPNHNLTLLAA